MNRAWEKRFSIIRTGQAFSIIGSAAVQFAVIWHPALHTGSPVTLAASAVAGVLPAALLGAFAGVWADRHDAR